MARTTSATPSSTTTGSASTTTKRQSRNTSAKRRRNWFFILLRVNLYPLALLYLFFGLLYVILGAHAFNILGSILSRDCTSDSAFNSIWRFTAVMYTAYSPFLILSASDFPRFAPMLYLYAFSVFVGGLVRVWTAYVFDIPGPPMGYFVVYIAMFHELSNPLIIALLLHFGLKLEKKRA